MQKYMLLGKIYPFLDIFPLLGGRRLVQYPLKLITMCPISAFITNQNFYILKQLSVQNSNKSKNKTSIVSTG